MIHDSVAISSSKLVSNHGRHLSISKAEKLTAIGGSERPSRTPHLQVCARLGFPYVFDTQIIAKVSQFLGQGVAIMGALHDETELPPKPDLRLMGQFT